MLSDDEAKVLPMQCCVHADTKLQVLQAATLLKSLGFNMDNMSHEEANNACSEVKALLLSIKQASDDNTPTPKEIELLNSANDSNKRYEKRKAVPFC